MNSAHAKLCCAGAALTVAILTALCQAQATCPGSDDILLDCNGNGTDDYCDIAAGTSPDAQGGNGGGRILVQNPAGAHTFINTGQAIPPNTCYRIRMVLENNAPEASSVQVLINDPLTLTLPLLNPAATRMDYLRVEQEVNGAPSLDDLHRSALDNVTSCRRGAPAAH